MRPSSKTSLVSADQSVPPMSAMWAMLPVQPTRMPSRNTGRDDGDVGEVAGGEPGVIADADIAVPPLRALGGCAGSACSVRESVMLKEGMPIVFSAMALPSRSKITQAKSLDSRTIGENEVRRSVAAASSAMAIRRVQTTWSATGSSMMDGIQALPFGWVEPISADADGVGVPVQAHRGGQRTLIGARRCRGLADLRNRPPCRPDAPASPAPAAATHHCRGADHEIGGVPRHPAS